MVEDYKITPDGKNYTLKIKQNIKWHNGDPLNTDDVLFTFGAIQDPAYKSPLRASFSGVQIERVDDNTVKFILSEPYAAFLNLLTFGIMPAGLWQEINPASASLAELNTKPIGSGPYKFKIIGKRQIRQY